MERVITIHDFRMNYTLKAEPAPMVEIGKKGVLNKTGGTCVYIPFTAIQAVVLSQDKQDIEIRATVGMKFTAWAKAEQLYQGLMSRLET
jgi:hypothetical protein